jgi:purine nucleosidase
VLRLPVRRIVLDTDLGTDADDAICLALALASPELELVAVTTVSGDATRRAQIARRLLDLAGRSDVPVHAGETTPLTAGSSSLWLGDEGDFLLGRDEPVPIASEPAVQALARLLRAEDGLEIVAVGPLTNLARLLEREPALAARIGRLTVMGGHVRRVAYGAHEFPHGVDYNLCSDAEASRRVLSAGLPIRLVTADVTLATWIGPADLERIEDAGTPFHRALARAIRAWTPHMRRIFGAMGAPIGDDNVAFLHDPLALAAVYDESFCRFEELAIEPTIEGGVFRTVEHSGPTTATRTMRCATAVDAARFRAHLVERILRFRRDTR